MSERASTPAEGFTVVGPHPDPAPEREGTRTGGIVGPDGRSLESRPGLLRVLGIGTAVSLVVGNVIGSGIFYKPGRIAAETGSFSLIIGAWIAGGVICLLGAFCLAELAAMLPRAGGLYVYLREAYGRPVAFLFGWTEFLFGKPASTGALAVAFVGALTAATGWRLGAVEQVLAALVLVAAISWANILGVIWGGRLQNVTTLIKAGFLGVVALLPFALIPLVPGGFDAANYATRLTVEASFSTKFAAAMLAVMWAYNGWHGIAPVAEEIRDPERNIPRALLIGICVLIALYVGANVAYHGVLSMPEMAAAGQTAAQAMIRKLLLPLGSGTAQTGVAAISAVIMCSTLGAINSNLLGASRVSFAMGRDDVFFRSLGLVHVVYRTPAVSIIVMGIMSAALVVGAAATVEASSAEQLNEVFTRLTNFVVFSASIFYVLAVLAVIVLRWRHPEWERPFRVPGYPLVPLIYLAFYGWFLWYVYNGGPGSQYSANMGLLFVAAGVPVYFAWRFWARRRAGVED